MIHVLANELLWAQHGLKNCSSGLDGNEFEVLGIGSKEFIQRFNDNKFLEPIVKTMNGKRPNLTESKSQLESS